MKVADFQWEWIELARANRNLVIWCPPEHGKSTHFSVLLPLWLLAHKPNYRIAIVSATQSQANKFGRVIRETIERNPVFRRVFPHVVPARPWTDNMLTIQRPAIMKDPSVQCVGIEGAILGARVDVLIFDDILTAQNTYTDYQRSKLMHWIQSTFITRVTKEGRIWAIGMKWHPDDAYHRLVREGGFAWAAFPALLDGKPLWPEVWPLERLRRREAEMTPEEWRRQYLLDLTPVSSAFFHGEWLERAKKMGEGIDPYHYPLGDNEHVVIGLDFGASETKSRSACHVLAVSPVKRTTLAAKAGHWRATDIKNVLEMYLRIWPNAVIAAEDNATQKLIIQMLRDSIPDVIILPVTTSARTYRPDGDIRQLAVELAKGQWRICTPDDPGIKEWLIDLLNYRGGHMPDTLAACIFARQVGVRLAQDVAAIAKEMPDYYPGAALIFWGKHKSLVKCRRDDIVEILSPDEEAPTFVVITQGWKRGYNLGIPVYEIPAPVRERSLAIRRYKSGYIKIKDMILLRELTSLNERKLRSRLDEPAIFALYLAVQAAQLLAGGQVISEDDDDLEQTTPKTDWDLLVQLGMPSPSMFMEAMNEI